MSMTPPPSAPLSTPPAGRRPCDRLAATLAGAGLLLAGSLLGLPAARAAAPSPAQIQALEAALNADSPAALAALLEAGPGLDPTRLEARRRLLRQNFPDVRWRLTPGTSLRDGRPTVNLRVTGTRRQAGTLFRLQADQQLALQSSGGRINGQTVLRESSILRSGEQELPVTLQIPDAVLTGQRYDIDLVLDDPLEGAYLAGGLRVLTPQQLAGMESPAIDLAALGGGGLFKTVQAPYRPGTQTWAVLLVHPKGVISATKQVRVVADKAALQP